jgi:hypothetical protein
MRRHPRPHASAPMAKRRNLVEADQISLTVPLVDSGFVPCQIGTTTRRRQIRSPWITAPSTSHKVMMGNQAVGAIALDTHSTESEDQRNFRKLSFI